MSSLTRRAFIALGACIVPGWRQAHPIWDVDAVSCFYAPYLKSELVPGVRVIGRPCPEGCAVYKGPYLLGFLSQRGTQGTDRRLDLAVYETSVRTDGRMTLRVAIAS